MRSSKDFTGKGVFVCPRTKVAVAAVNDKNFDVILTTEDNLSVFMCLKKLKISIERKNNRKINVSIYAQIPKNRHS